jgi:hypothetical protein
MDLMTAYRETEKRLNSIDFSALWEGFERAEFALYNDSEVIFRGERLEKTDEFLANTTICFRGENIAIWMLSEETDLDVLASKLAHEMFHAYQMDKREARFPNESDGVFRYSFSPEPLSGRLRLNRAQ